MKPTSTAREAVSEIPDGATVLVSGFGGAGTPVELLHALIDHGARDLTVVNNNVGNGYVGLAALIATGRVRKMICSFPQARRAASSTGAPTSSKRRCAATSRWSRRCVPTRPAT